MQRDIGNKLFLLKSPRMHNHIPKVDRYHTIYANLNNYIGRRVVKHFKHMMLHVQLVRINWI